ncbi:MAG: YitT family protein [Chloroflexota bacterium]
MYYQKVAYVVRRVPLLGIKIAIQRGLLLVVGSVLIGLGYSLFQIPFGIVSGGTTGVGIILNHLWSWPVGLFNLMVNLPLLLIGYRALGGWRFVFATLIGITVSAFAIDFFTMYPLVSEPITEDRLLSSIYAGLIVGIGGGLVYRGGGNPGGTAILGRMIEQKTGLPLSQVYLYIDGLIILVGGAVFGWEIVLLGLLVVFLGGVATDFVLEGASTVRTATIVTDKPEQLSQALMAGLQKGVSYWSMTGGYSGQSRTMLFCTIQRPQVNDLKHIVAMVDPHAFLVIGNAYQALGSQFSRLRR